MLFTELSTAVLVICALTVAFCFAIVVWVRRLARFVHYAVEEMRIGNKRSVSLARIAELDATLTELLDAYNALHTSHKKLRSRIGMRENRQQKANGVDSDEDARARDKNALREKARKAGHTRL